MRNPKAAQNRYSFIRSWLPLFLIFLGSLAIGSFISYSDGDDSIFLGEIAARPHFRSFFIYLTKTMNGRLSATASLWVVFHFHIWVWRVLNALMITVTTAFLYRIICLFSDRDSRVKGEEGKLFFWIPAL